MGKNNAKLPWTEGMIQVGIDPKTGLPLKLGMGKRCNTKDDLKRLFRDQDKRLNVNMFEWYNTQLDIKSQDINRLLYYRGQLAFAYLEDLDQFVLLPYVIDGNLDMYGRAKYIRLLPFASSLEDPRMKPVEDYLASKRFKVVNTIKTELEEKDLVESAVILYDYTPQLSYNVIPQSVMNEVLIDLESEIYTYIRTAGLNATGTRAVRVSDADQEEVSKAANMSLVEAAQRAELYVPVVGNIDFQELTSGTSDIPGLLQIAQSIHNLRMSLNGLPAGGVYEKTQYQNNQEVGLNQGQIDSALVLQDKLSNRKEFTNIVNSIWYLGINVLPSENVVMGDLDANGVVYDDADPETEQGGEDNE